MHLEEQVSQITQAVHRLGMPKQRCVIAIAGPPAAGKSSIAEGVAAALEADGTPCGLIPMDGFHLDNAVLEARGLLKRKGAPESARRTGGGHGLETVPSSSRD